MKRVTNLASHSFQDSLSSSYHIPSKVMFRSIGKSVCQQIQYEQEEINIKEKLKNTSTRNGNILSQAAILRRGEMMKKTATENILRGRNRDKFDDFPMEIQIKIGALLTYLLKETAKIKTDTGFVENLIDVSYIRRGSRDSFIGVLKIHE